MVPLTAGAIIDRRFRLTVPLGPPARGTEPAWRATELSTGAGVAVKLLPAHRAGDTAAGARFRLAVRTISQLTSPEVTRILDHGEITQPGGFAVPYVVRELADGQPLADLLSRGALPVEEALRVVATAADALAVAHPAGLVHGRIQPGNVIVGPDRVRITDFGLGALSPAAADGQLRYQAPELAAGGCPAPAADMYAVGVLFATCLAGVHRPAGAAARLMPPSLTGLSAACLAISPRDRPGAAHVAVLVRQALADIVGPRLTGTGPMVAMAAMAASSPLAPHPAVPAARWPG